LAEWFVNPEDTVLDGYAGGGNLAAAALERGARVIVADSDPEWAIFCADRFSQLLTT
jgi:16S rRNA G966 N2-methylase RsmD